MKEIIKAFRLRDQNPIIVAYLFGLLDSSIKVFEYFVEVIFYLIVLILISILCFFVNQYTDKDTDTICEKEASKLSKTQFWIVFIIFTLTIAVCIYWSSYKILLIITYLLAISYSFPKIRLKAHGPFDQLILLSVYVIIPYITPYLIFYETNILSFIKQPNYSWLSLAFLILYLGSTNLIAMAKDYDCDYKAGLKTTGVKLGHKCTMILGIASTLSFMFLGFFIQYKFHLFWYYIMNIFGVFLLYVFIKGMKIGFKNYKNKLKSYTKLGINFGWLLVLYLIIIIIINNV